MKIIMKFKKIQIMQRLYDLNENENRNKNKK